MKLTTSSIISFIALATLLIQVYGAAIARTWPNNPDARQLDPPDFRPTVTRRGASDFLRGQLRNAFSLSPTSQLGAPQKSDLREQFQEAVTGSEQRTSVFRKKPFLYPSQTFAGVGIGEGKKDDIIHEAAGTAHGNVGGAS
ncbi:hypothetical protein C8J55DRAFT_514997 [Lentinula edodes]|uniref:Uncharacterized protein n=1 Tax=Lentinula lateritia TaxID=40482 RepID=A0A9W9AE15_9AGAR|nr:hypothetical protein C8J55DRAFT_514997 [Lentinula edodes]